jgi:hypothetical protein
MIDAGPQRADFTALVFGRLTGSEPPDASSIVEVLDEKQRTVIRITPSGAHLHH